MSTAELDRDEPPNVLQYELDEPAPPDPHWSGKHNSVFAALAAPFAPQEVKSRSQGGKQLYYVTARTVMNRLDAVLGPENWWDEYIPCPNSVVCGISVLLPDGRVLKKFDAGGYAGMSDQGDDDKSGYSDAFKRAAVKLGVGRYLYRDGVPDFARDAASAAPEREQPRPQARDERRPEPPRGNGGNGNGNGGGHGAPRSGRGLFAWVKEMEQKHDVRLLVYLNNWGKHQEFPGRMVDWSPEQVEMAHAEGAAKLRAVLPGGEGDGADY